MTNEVLCSAGTVSAVMNVKLLKLAVTGRKDRANGETETNVVLVENDGCLW